MDGYISFVLVPLRAARAATESRVHGTRYSKDIYLSIYLSTDCIYMQIDRQIDRSMDRHYSVYMHL